MPLWLPVVTTAIRFIGPKPKQQGTAAFMLLPPLIVGGFVLLYFTGVIKPDLASLFTLPIREMGMVVLGTLVAMGAAKDKRLWGFIAGIAIAFIGLSNITTSMFFLQENGFGAILRDKFPAIEECLPNPSGFWDEHWPDITVREKPEINFSDIKFPWQ